MGAAYPGAKVGELFWGWGTRGVLEGRVGL